MPSRIQNAGIVIKGFGFWILGLAGTLLILILAGLMLYGMVWASAKLLPFLQDAGEIAGAVCLFIFLPLSAFRKTRPFAGMGYYYASFVFGILLFAYSCVVAFWIWHFTGLIIGLFIGGVGVVPVAFLATLFHGEWDLFWNVVLGTVLTFGSRG